MQYLLIIFYVWSFCVGQERYSFVVHYEPGEVEKNKGDTIWSFEMPQGITESGVSKKIKIKCLGYEDGFLLLEETMTDLVATEKTLDKISADHEKNALIGIPYTLYIDTLSGLVDHIETDYKEYEELIKNVVMGIASNENRIYPYGENAVNIKVGDSWSPPPDSVEIYMGDEGNPNYMIFNYTYTLNKVKQKKGVNIAYITGIYEAFGELEFFQNSKLFEGKVQGEMKDKIRFNLNDNKVVLNKLSCSMDWALHFEEENMNVSLEIISKEKRIK